MVQELSFAKLFKIAFSAEYLTGTTSGLPTYPSLDALGALIWTRDPATLTYHSISLTQGLQTVVISNLFL